MIDLMKKIDLAISSLPNITSSPSYKDVTNGVILDPPISFPQPHEFKEGEKSEGDLRAHVHKCTRTYLMWMSKANSLS